MARDKDATAGVLKRKQELEAISQETVELNEKVIELEDIRQGNEQRLRSLEATRQEIAGNVAQQQNSYAELRSKLSGFEVQIEQYKARKERAETELTEVQQQTES